MRGLAGGSLTQEQGARHVSALSRRWRLARLLGDGPFLLFEHHEVLPPSRACPSMALVQSSPPSHHRRRGQWECSLHIYGAVARGDRLDRHPQMDWEAVPFLEGEIGHVTAKRTNPRKQRRHLLLRSTSATWLSSQPQHLVHPINHPFPRPDGEGVIDGEISCAPRPKRAERRARCHRARARNTFDALSVARAQ